MSVLGAYIVSIVKVHHVKNLCNNETCTKVSTFPLWGRIFSKAIKPAQVIAAYTKKLREKLRLLFLRKTTVCFGAKLMYKVRPEHSVPWPCCMVFQIETSSGCTMVLHCLAGKMVDWTF